MDGNMVTIVTGRIKNRDNNSSASRKFESESCREMLYPETRTGITRNDKIAFERLRSSIDQLNHLEKGKDTRHLLGLLPENVVECGVRVYKIMQKIAKDIPPIRQESLKRAAKILGYSSRELLDVLRRHPDPRTSRRIKFGELIDPETNLNVPVTKRTIRDAALELGFQSDELLKILSDDPKLSIEEDESKEYRKRSEKKGLSFHGGADYPLSILVFYLREHLKRKTGKVHNELIDGFLCEQSFSDARNPSSISRRATLKGREFKDVYDFFRDLYNFFREIFLAFSTSDNSLETILAFELEKGRLASDKAENEPDVFFPIWENFLSSKP